MPTNPHRFVQADALEYLVKHADSFDAVHASPPCQSFSRTKSLHSNQYPDLIAPLRAILEDWGGPYVIENVPSAPLVNTMLLCGTMFDLRMYRHRLFEANFPIKRLKHPIHRASAGPLGRKSAPDEFLQLVGNFVGIEEARAEMKMPWATRAGISEAIPPAYSEYVGGQLKAYLGGGLQTPRSSED